MKKVFSVTFGLISALSLVQGESLSGVPGAFVPLPLGANGGGHGGIQTANPLGVEAAIYNPAGVNQIENWGAAYNYLSQLNMISFHNGVFLYRPDSSAYVYGATITENGDEVYREGEVALTLGRSYKMFDFGLNWKWRYATTGDGGTDLYNPEGKNTKVEGSGFGISGFDLGVIYHYSKRIHFGAVLQDAFSAVTWSTSNDAGTAKGDYTEFIPVAIKFGLSTQPYDWWEINLDYSPSFYEDGKMKIGASTEFLPIYFVKDPRWKEFVQIRFGWQQNLADEDRNRKWSFGGGLLLPLEDGYAVRIDGGYRLNMNFDDQNTPLVGISVVR